MLSHDDTQFILHFSRSGRRKNEVSAALRELSPAWELGNAGKNFLINLVREYKGGSAAKILRLKDFVEKIYPDQRASAPMLKDLINLNPRAAVLSISVLDSLKLAPEELAKINLPPDIDQLSYINLDFNIKTRLLKDLVTKKITLSDFNEVLAGLKTLPKVDNDLQKKLIGHLIKKDASSPLEGLLNGIIPEISRIVKEQPKQSVKALCAIYQQHSSGAKQEVFDKFMTMIEPEKNPRYKGHSVGFEIEIYSRPDQEVRIGPFCDNKIAFEKLGLAHELTCYNKDTPFSTLHINFGLTETQERHYNRDSSLYNGILRKLSYISNSAPRNIRSAHFYHYDVFNNYLQGSDFVNCAGEEHAEKQVKRLECKNFCLAQDADLDIIKLTIPAFQAALDNPDRAKTLNKHLDAIFNAAFIDMQSVPDGDIDEAAKKGQSEAIKRVNSWCEDFGVIPYGKDEIMGRQAGFRPIVSYYLQSFIDRHEDQEISSLLQTTGAVSREFARLEARGNADYPGQKPRNWRNSLHSQTPSSGHERS